MPGNRQNQNNGVSTPSNSSADNLEEAMWRLKIQTHEDQEGDLATPYPQRPGESDCLYYLRTGLCGYGSNCRFNHPPNPRQATQSRGGELPERDGEPDCQFFLKTGTCKFGATCKYHHPRDRHDAAQVPLNIIGLPMRQEEKACSYYMRTGSCKFGVSCKFNHPQPATLGAVLPIAPSAYNSLSSSTSPSSGLHYYGALPAWPLPRAPYLSGSNLQCPPAYMPVVFSPSLGMMPAQPGWSTYMGALSPVSSSEALSANLGAVYKSKLQHLGEPHSSSPLHMLSASVTNLPERPDEPECQYFMKNGSCKYGQTCKYHHPKERNAPPLAVETLGPLGLPLRPGQEMCTSYCMYGICKYGSACKFDHPLSGYFNYCPPALSILDPSPMAPYQRRSPVATSSSESSPSKTKAEETSTIRQQQQQNPETTESP